MSYSNKEFIEDLIKYFTINTDKIDQFMNAKVNMKDTNELYTNTIVKDSIREMVKDMYKYECTKCKKIWYTSNPYANAQKCESCGGKIKNKGVAK